MRNEEYIIEEFDLRRGQNIKRLVSREPDRVKFYLYREKFKPQVDRIYQCAWQGDLIDGRRITFEEAEKLVQELNGKMAEEIKTAAIVLREDRWFVL
jgi:hypothetical protein